MENQVSPAIKSARSKKLEVIEQKCRLTFMNSLVGQTLPVLFEQKKGNAWEGYTENYLPVLLISDNELSGKLIPAHISGTDGHFLFAEV